MTQPNPKVVLTGKGDKSGKPTSKLIHPVRPIKKKFPKDRR